MKELTQTQIFEVNGGDLPRMLLVVGIGAPIGAYIGLMTAGNTLASMCVMANHTLEYCGEILNNTFLSTAENATNVGAGVFYTWMGVGSLLGISAMAGVVLAAA